jgi:DNA-binding transcriptional MerR regulator
MQTTFTISDLADTFGITHRALRFYEDKGLIKPRREGSNRVYGRRDHARLRLILLGKRVGLSLSEIKEMLDVYDLKEGRTPQLKAALARFSEQIEMLKRQRRDVDQAIAELSHTIALVAGMLRDREAADGKSVAAVLEAAE